MGVEEGSITDDVGESEPRIWRYCAVKLELGTNMLFDRATDHNPCRRSTFRHLLVSFFGYVVGILWS